VPPAALPGAKLLKSVTIQLLEQASGGKVSHLAAGGLFSTLALAIEGISSEAESLPNNLNFWHRIWLLDIFHLAAFKNLPGTRSGYVFITLLSSAPTLTEFRIKKSNYS